jgi:hypothetical protein
MDCKNFSRDGPPVENASDLSGGKSLDHNHLPTAEGTGPERSCLALSVGPGGQSWVHGRGVGLQQYWQSRRSAARRRPERTQLSDS